ncbi:MAG: 2-hydroxyacyl-CoA dehydratase, partial [Oscillospiraceae bacterium]|nr:2-hydroxyacyl-CoA dehydratase [Oscillospiraceae bacterium]
MEVREILDVFRSADPSALKAKYLAEGRKIVLTAPVYTPEEIIHSMGLVPMGVWGADVLLERSKRYFPAFICSVVQSIVELGMRGTYDGASAIVIPSLCDSLKVVGQNWKYAVPGIPFIPMTYPQNRA